MKKKTVIIIAAIAGAVVLVWGIFQSGASTANQELSTDEMRELISSQYPGEITELELETGNSEVVYEVVVENNGKEYVIRMDRISGEVLNMKETLVSENNAKDKNAQADTKNNSDANHEGKKNEADSSNESSSNAAVIGTERAKEIALNEFQGTVVELEQDEDDGRLIYDIKVENGEDEAEIEIDAYTGEVIMVDIDLEDN